MRGGVFGYRVGHHDRYESVHGPGDSGHPTLYQGFLPAFG